MEKSEYLSCLEAEILPDFEFKIFEESKIEPRNEVSHNNDGTTTTKLNFYCNTYTTTVPIIQNQQQIKSKQH